MTGPIPRRAILAGGLAFGAGAALAQPDSGLTRVALTTAKGVITADLNLAQAPITARNFLRYVDQHRLDGAAFYRVAHTPNRPEFGLVQGGLRGDPAKLLKPIAHESTAKTGLTHKDGTLSMARRAPGSATADFFICIGEHPGFDADPSASGDNLGFAAFGQVADGMDVVRAIFALPISTAPGPMRGEMLRTPVKIITARRG